jgi:CBS domain containing-hemolysin-like protein
MNTFTFLANVADPVGAPATSWDVPGIILLKLLAVIFLVLLNGFFVASEFAIVKVRASQLDALAGPSNGRARLARHVTSHLDSYLSATQLGITLASLGLGWLGEPFLAEMIEPFFALAGVHSAVLIQTVSFALAFTTITILHIVLGELAPKSLAIRKAVPTTLWISRPLRLFYLVFKPAIWLLNGLANWLLKRILRLDPVAENELAHSEQELRLILDESVKASKISKVSQEIVANAFEMRQRLVREVMTPRREVVYLDSGLSFRDNLQRAKTARHTRFPLCADHFDRTIGLVHIKDILAQLDEPEPSLPAITKELLVVPEMMALEKLLTRFRDQQTHLAVVLDEFVTPPQSRLTLNVSGLLAMSARRRKILTSGWKPSDIENVARLLVSNPSNSRAGRANSTPPSGTSWTTKTNGSSIEHADAGGDPFQAARRRSNGA